MIQRDYKDKLKQIFYIIFNLLTFWLAKVLSKSFKSSDSNKFFPIDIVVNPFNLSYDILVRRKVLISFNFEKLLSAVATVTGIVNNIL